MAFDQTDTVVSFGANTQELEAGVNRVSNTLSGFANGTGSIFENLKNMVTGHVNGINDGIGGLKTGADGLSNIIEGIGSHFAGLSALLAGGALFAEGIKAFSDETAETKKLMNGLGMTAEAASKFNTELKVVGMSAEQYVGIAMKFDRQLKTNEESLRALGVTTRDGNGKLLDQQTLLQNAANTMMTYKAGVDRNEVAMTMFGRSADSAYALLKLNEKTSERAAELTKAYGLELDDVAMGKAKNYKLAIGEAKLVGESFAAHIGEAVMPMLTSLAKGFTDVAIITVPKVNDGLELMGLVFTGTGKIVRKFVEESIDLFNQFRGKSDETFRNSGPESLSIYEQAWQLTANGINDLIYSIILGMDKLLMETKATVNDISGIWNVFSSGIGTKAGDAADLKWQQDNIAIRKAGHAKIIADDLAYRVEMERIAGAHREIPKLTKGQQATTDWANQSMGGADKSAPEAPGKAGKAAAEQSYVPKWDAQLADAKVYYAATHDLRELSKQQEIAFWESALAQTNLTDTEKIEIQRKVSKLRLEIQKEERKEALGLATEGIKAEQAAAMAGLSYDEEIAKTKYDLNQTSFEEYQNQLTAFENRRYEIEKAAQEKLIELDKSSPNNAVKVKQDKDKLIALEQTHSLNYLKIVGATTKEAAAKWQTLYKSISDGLGSSVAGFIVGTKSLSTALSGIYTSIQGAFEKMIGDMISKWITGQLTMLFVKESTNASIESADALAATAAAINAKVQASMQIPAIAGVAAGEAAASQAGIPVVGPALAAAAYAETMAMVMSGLALASASSGYDIPAGVNPLTQLHQNEMVLPAHLADSVRSMSGNGGRSNGDVHLHVSAVDAHSVRRLFENNGSALADALKHQARNLKR
jgi:hypothetical protein